jgi:putative flippase GtrA
VSNALTNSRWLATFKRYTTVGLVNTLLHWVVFLVLHWGLGTSQSIANLVAFCLAVSFSFFVNARYTFQQKTSLLRYISFVLAMGILSYFTGLLGDSLGTPPLLTLIIFSTLSLILGYLYSSFCVFRK